MEKINIAEILKDCPSGMELDCAMYDNVQFDIVQDGNVYPIKINAPEGRISLSKYGCYSLNPQCKCIIFPKGKTTWEGFHRPFKDGDIVFYNDTIAIFKEWDNEISFRTDVIKYLCCNSLIDINTPLFGENVRKEIRFATEEEKEKLFYAIKAFGYKWDPETKTLKELEVKKFDITTLKPFDKVLTRVTTGDVWGNDFFGYYKDRWFHCSGHIATHYCIPFEGNEHLLGTTDDCDDFYKTWE